MSPLRWTLTSTYELARQLTAQGFKVSAELVRGMSREQWETVGLPLYERCTRPRAPHGEPATT